MLRRAAIIYFFLLIVQLPVLAQNASFWASRSFTAPDGTVYIRYEPPSYDGSEAYAMLVYLHGGDAIDNGEEAYQAANYGPPKVIESNRWDNSRKLIVVAPKLPNDPLIEVNDQLWELDRVRSVIDDVKATLNVNEDKVYLTGTSVGGKAVYDMLALYPNEFAAAFPFSSNADLSTVCLYKDVPIWGFHGNRDGLVEYDDSRDGVRYGTKVVIDALNSCTPAASIPARYTEFDMYDHHGWQQTYEGVNGYDIYSYMLSMDRSNTGNIAPFVTAMGEDMKIEQRDGTFTLLGRVYDADGTISSMEWTSLLSSSPAIDICDANSETLILDNLEVGNYTFRLTATDNDGATSFDDFNLQVVAANDYANEISDLRLVTLSDITNTLQVLSQDAVINLADYDLTVVKLDFKGDATNTSVRYGWDYNRYYAQYFNADKTMKEGRVASYAPISLGTHYLYAALFGGDWGRTPKDTWLQYRIHVVDEPNQTLDTPPDFSAIALSSGTQVDLSWSMTGNTNSQFEIQRSNCSSESFTTIYTTSIGQDNYVDSGLTPEETYRYRMRAIDGIEFSAYAPQLLVTTMEEPLPVTLMYFEAEPKGRNVLLQWATASEVNHAFFKVQRSDNANDWTDLHTIQGNGDSQGIRRYTYTDREAGSGIVYYRLMQQDFDGTTSFSELVRVNMSQQAAALGFYPNPSGSGAEWRAAVSGLGAGEEVHLTVMDSRGRHLLSQTMTIEDLQTSGWQMEGLPSGIYMLKAETPAGQYNQRMVIR